MRIAASIVFALLAVLFAAPVASATEPICEEYDRYGNCVIGIEIPGNDGGTTPPIDNPGGGDGGGGGGGDTKCRFQGDEIPCSNGFGTWNGSCYVKQADPQPPKDDPIWDGHDDGVIVECLPYICIPTGGDNIPITDCPGRQIYWAPAPPPGGGGPTPEQLARQAIEQMNFRAGEIAMAPQGVSVVGFQTWLWVGDPGESTTGPIERSVGGVTATGTLDRIVYDMGDGQTVTCQGPGTPYKESYGDADSPDCGHTYTRTSRNQPGLAYTVTATSYWTVNWAGGGQSGTIPLDFTTSVQHQVAELQSILRRDASLQ
ncbi:hypothetical protein [Promicromonospora sp. NFX87]|uniref:hypothetical protein n=1 Tax=Promicromonospora sp. NFX87 TaxID=3402691 RepID=UPI003AFABA0F